jgi:hypothetical protein
MGRIQQEEGGAFFGWPIVGRYWCFCGDKKSYGFSCQYALITDHDVWSGYPYSNEHVVDVNKSDWRKFIIG